MAKISLQSILKSDNWEALILEAYPGCDLTFWAKRRQRVLSGVQSKSFGKQPKDNRQMNTQPESILWQIESRDFVTTISRDMGVSYTEVA